MWDSGGLRALQCSLVQDTVFFDHSPAVAEDGESPRTRLQPACGFLGVVLGNDEEDGVPILDFGVGFLQLTELRFAEWSPRAATYELHHHVPALEFREPVALSLRVLEFEVRGTVPYFRPLRPPSRTLRRGLAARLRNASAWPRRSRGLQQHRVPRRRLEAVDWWRAQRRRPGRADGVAER